MSKMVGKFQLPIKESFSLEMPIGAEVVRVEGIDGHIWMWAVIDTEAPKEKRHFMSFKTGGDMPADTELKYVGCGAVFVQQELMLYYFEVVE